MGLIHLRMVSRFETPAGEHAFQGGIGFRLAVNATRFAFVGALQPSRYATIPHCAVIFGSVLGWIDVWMS
jgi:hypothetical protein